MQEQEIRELLAGIPQVNLERSKIVEGKKGSWLMFPCPLASITHQKGTDRHPSFGISLGQQSCFHCFTCGYKGRFRSLLRIISDFYGLDLKGSIDLADKLDRETVESILYQKRDEHQRLILSDKALIWPSVLTSLEGMEYLASRRINAEQAKFWDLRFDEKNQNVVFPVRTIGINGAVGRNVHKKKYHNYFGMDTSDCLGGYDKLSPDTKKLILVEGHFGMINIFPIARRFGYDVVCSFTAKCSDVQKELILNTDKRLFVGYDLDSAGTKGYAEIRDSGKFRSLSRIRWKDTTKDLGDFTEQELIDLFSS